MRLSRMDTECNDRSDIPLMYDVRAEAAQLATDRINLAQIQDCVVRLHFHHQDLKERVIFAQRTVDTK